MKSIQKMGGFSAFNLAVAYSTGIILFLFVFDCSNITAPSQKVAQGLGGVYGEVAGGLSTLFISVAALFFGQGSKEKEGQS